MTETIKKGYGKYVWVIGVISLMGLFGYLESLDLEVTCQDKVCETGVECELFCNVTNPTYTTVYLFNHDDWKVTFSPDVADVDVYWRYYGKWRYTNFTRETRATNIKEDAKYVFSFPRYKTTQFKMLITVKETTEIKWNFGIKETNLISYEHLFEQVPYEVQEYATTITQYPSTFNQENGTWSKAYNKTVRKKTGTRTEYKQGKKIGLKVGNDIYQHAVIEGNNLSVFTVPTGERYVGCLDYEIKKGVCNEKSII